MHSHREHARSFLRKSFSCKIKRKEWINLSGMMFSTPTYGALMLIVKRRSWTVKKGFLLLDQKVGYCLIFSLGCFYARRSMKMVFSKKFYHHIIWYRRVQAPLKEAPILAHRKIFQLGNGYPQRWTDLLEGPLNLSGKEVYQGRVLEQGWSL